MNVVLFRIGSEQFALGREEIGDIPVLQLMPIVEKLMVSQQS